LPGNVYRLKDHKTLFGVSKSMMFAMIKNGEIPTPIPLTDGGKIRGWLGQQVLEWQAGRLEKAKAETVRRTARTTVAA
jgi:predicted DNA-binding transcriptional regulator AlpA